MTADEAALWRGVLDRPADDLARLVYADYLEDHGRVALARFIRAQIRLANAPPGHPDYADAVEAQSLAVAGARAAAALPVPELPEGVTFAGNISDVEQDGYGSYSRGLPDCVTVNWRQSRPISVPLAEALGRVMGRSTARQVVLANLPTPEVVAALNSPAGARLDGVRLDVARPDDRAEQVVGLTGSAAAAVLTRLEVPVHVSPAALDALFAAHFPLLRELHLDPAPSLERFRVSDARWLTQLTRLAVVAYHSHGLKQLLPMAGAGLTALGLSVYSRVVQQDYREFSAVPLPNLRELSLDTPELDPHTTATLVNWGFPPLASVRVIGGRVSAGFAPLLAADWMSGLTELVVRERFLPPLGDALIRSPAAASVRLLTFVNAMDAADDLVALARPGAFPVLSTLCSSRATRGDPAAVVTFAEAWSGRLHTLILDGWQVTAAAAQRFAANPAFASLRRLKLRGCKLGDAAAAVLLTSPHLQGLVEVDFAMNPVGERTAAALMRADTLPELLLADLTGNRMHPDTRNKLRAARAGVWA